MPVNKKQEQRPDPDDLLERIRRAARGKLTVFLGAAAGVGKTYTMLELARERAGEGIDVVIGWVETHGRKETERLATGLERVPPRILNYNGRDLPEMDIDAIIRRRPELVLVDELAHANVHGSRHVRRFQDVEELLKAGISVYTTLNVQHLESLNDVVAQITGVVVRETVPDHIVEQADSVQLIDIPPEDLIKRLKEGKVYIRGQVEQALRHFFRPGNINALRELALRYTASRVDKELSEYMREHNIEGPWPASGRVMVCVGASPFSAQLIRAARRLATGLQPDWIALHVELARRSPLSDAERDRISRNMKLAAELGALTLSVTGDDMVESVLETARLHNVTAIVVGKPRHGRLWELINGSIVDKLLRRSCGINIYVIQANKENARASGIVTTSSPKTQNKLEYAGGLAMIMAVTVVGWLLKGNIEIGNIALLYQLPVVLSAFWWGRWQSYFTAVFSVLVFDFLFIAPIFTFTVYDLRYLWSFITFLVIAFVIGGRTEILRHEAAAARKRERSTRALYEFSRGIAAVIDPETIVRELTVQAAETLGRKVAVLLPDARGRLAVWADYEPGGDKESAIRRRRLALAESSEMAVAVWAYEHGEVAGRSTETLPGARFLYLPLRTGDTVVGVMGVQVVERLVTPEQRHLMDAWASLAAVAIERVKLAGKAHEAALLREADRLRTALFNSISHELKTPLSSILGSVSALLESETLYSPESRRELLENIKDGADRMDRVVANLLDTARLETGTLKLKTDWCDMEDIIGAALRRLQDRLKDRPLRVEAPDAISLLQADCVLIEQVIINIIDNALKYSPPGSALELGIEQLGRQIRLAVADRGVGIPEADLAKVFDKFYRAQHREIRASGTGLGLSICKGIVEAHGGEIWAEKRTGGGTVVSFTLPLEPPEKEGKDNDGERYAGIGD